MITIEDIPLMPRCLGEPLYPIGLPLNFINSPWCGDIRDRVYAAYQRYLDVNLEHTKQPLSTEEIDLLRQFLLYYIHAPMWEFCCHASPEVQQQLHTLQSFAGTITEIEDINEFVKQALDLGLDPF